MGFFSGMLISVAPKVIDETVPASIIDKGFGTSTNIMVCFAIMGVTLTAIANPSSDDIASLKTSNMWRVIYGLNIPFSALAIIMCLFVHREDSLTYHL